jgi:hypothetical protein
VSDVDLRFNPNFEAELVRSEEVRAELMRHAYRVVARAKATAPKRTGAGAASIHAERVGDEVHIGWDPEHGYLKYQDYVHSHYGHASHFLEDALISLSSLGE